MSTAIVLSPGYTYNKGSSAIWQEIKSFAEGIIAERDFLLVICNEEFEEEFLELEQEVREITAVLGEEGGMLKIREEDRSEDCYLYMSASGGGDYRLAKEFLARVIVRMLTDKLLNLKMNLSVNFS